MSARVAALFDLDGTLLPPPSLEQRFFRMLRYRREIPLKNYFLWLRDALKVLPRGIGGAMHANKMYLRGVHSLDDSGAENPIDSRAHKSGPKEEGQASASPRRIPRWPVPHFFEEGVERVVWHAKQGHVIVIVSGTLQPLANVAARNLEKELAARGIAAGIRVYATKLEENYGRLTGHVFGEAMFGKAKARAIFKVAEEMSLDLSQSWAYGDSAQDRWMLASVGNAAVVNPTANLVRIARKRGWPVIHWPERRNLTQRHGEPRDKKEDKREARTSEAVLQSQKLKEPPMSVEQRA